MIAIITSTIFPCPETYSFFTPQERFNQTIDTIKSLSKHGFKEIYLLDNSYKKIDVEEIQSYLDFPIHIMHQFQYSFANKGLSEAILILNNLINFPDDTPIFKISGRYNISNAAHNKSLIDAIKHTDIVGKGYNFHTRNGQFSTRGYCIANKKIYETLLVKAMEHIHTHFLGIHGFKSARDTFVYIFKPQIGSPYQTSLEHAFSVVIKNKLNYKLVDNLGIEGQIAGSPILERIVE